MSWLSHSLQRACSASALLLTMGRLDTYRPPLTGPRDFAHADRLAATPEGATFPESSIIAMCLCCAQASWGMLSSGGDLKDPPRAVTQGRYQRLVELTPSL